MSFDAWKPDKIEKTKGKEGTAAYEEGCFSLKKQKTHYLKVKVVLSVVWRAVWMWALFRVVWGIPRGAVGV